MADKITLTTPKGKAVYPKLITPDTKFKELGEYVADLSVPSEEAKTFISKVEEIYKSHVGKAAPKNPEKGNKNSFYYIERDEQGNATGNIVLKLRVANKQRKDGEIWDRRPRMFDAKLKPITGLKSLWGGTEMKVSCEVYCYQMATGKGVSLQPLGVQIINLVEGTGGGASADSYGFSAEEGFTAEDAEESIPFSADDAAEDADY